MTHVEKCPLCTVRPMATTAEQAMKTCQPCATKLGLIPMPPSRRPPTPCARCKGLHFLRVIPRVHTPSPTELGGQMSTPLHATHAPTSNVGWGLNMVNQLEIDHTGLGLLEMFICRSCGAVEWYCFDVDRIPADPHLMTEAIDYGGDTPYR